MYSDVTSRVPSILDLVTLRPSTLFMKSVVSFMYDFLSFTLGFRKLSTKAEIFSVGQLLAETWSTWWWYFTFMYFW